MFLTALDSPAFSILLFPLIWLAVSWLIAQGGWRQLSHSFRASYATSATAKQTAWFQSASLRPAGSKGQGTQYRGVLTVDYGPLGMELSVFFPFRVGHPPLFIPWSAVSPLQEEKGLFGWGKNYVFLISPPDGSTGVELCTAFALADTIEMHRQVAMLGH